MSSCAICLDTLKDPVALPCGHVYCHGCISEGVKATASTSSLTIHCPTCREPVSAVIPDSSFIPPHIRPYVLPPFRRIYLNTPTPSLAFANTERGSNLTAEVEEAVARVHTENAIVRQSCDALHSRANMHMTAHIRLSSLLLLARDQARKLKDECNDLARKYDSLKRKFSDVDRELEPEVKSNQEERVLILAESTPQAQDEAEADLHALSERVPCVPLMCPVTDGMPGVSLVSGPELQGNSKRVKRPRLSPTSLHSEVPTKPTPSIPAIIIPHLVSYRTATSPRSMIFDC